ncbi:hypothetical protein EYF80_066340 [Liparis tanakae]|uniref:Uncharacterized protein n=1 Tax=Liparis tanakae TaxID=230148 RepID=A0A4Z2E446_9TELE|nr:hypothetical protein EYF80_066340 [Liparis tanakae]
MATVSLHNNACGGRSVLLPSVDRGANGGTPTLSVHHSFTYQSIKVHISVSHQERDDFFTSQHILVIVTDAVRGHN